MKNLISALLLLLPFGAVSAIELEGRDKVPNAVAGYIEEILTAADLTSASISRGSATPADQARVMYDYYLRQNAPNCKEGKTVHSHTCACASYEDRIACARASYGSIGDAAFDAISDPASRAAAISEMTARIAREIEAAGNSRNQMAHVPISGRYAVDLRPSSIADSASFIAAVNTHPRVIRERFFYPGKAGGPAETAFHIEFRID